MKNGPTIGPRHSHSFPTQPFGHAFTDPSALNVPLSDISTMMFPSADPMAYPIQPMTTFEDSHLQHFGYRHDSPSLAEIAFRAAGLEMRSSPPVFGGPGGVGNAHHPAPRHPDTEAQLLGPMPMYLMQGAQQRAMQPIPTSHAPLIPPQDSASLNFDEIFGGEEWPQTLMDPQLGLSGQGAGYGPVSFGPSGPSMGAWH